MSEMGRVWLITGASSGLGRGLAEAALRAGEQVVGTARQVDRFDPLIDLFGAALLPLAHDVRDVDHAADVVQRALDRFGHIDVLVNNAGVGQVGAAEEVTDEELRDMLAQHLFGPAAFVRAALPSMRAAERGTIVQMSSQGGRRSFPAVGSYSAGKFALEGWSEALAAEIAPFGIRVLIVEPSRFRTEFNTPGVLRIATHDPAYDGALAAVRMDMTTSVGTQEGDPARGAAIIRQVLASPTPPLRLPLGAEAVRTLTYAYENALAEVQEWGPLASTADFPNTVTRKRSL